MCEYVSYLCFVFLNTRTSYVSVWIMSTLFPLGILSAFIWLPTYCQTHHWTFSLVFFDLFDFVPFFIVYFSFFLFLYGWQQQQCVFSCMRNRNIRVTRHTIFMHACKHRIHHVTQKIRANTYTITIFVYFYVFLFRYHNFVFYIIFLLVPFVCIYF